MQWIQLMLIFLLSGCTVLVPSPLPTPTTRTGVSLPIEPIFRNYVCEFFDTEYQLFFINDLIQWNDLWLQLQSSGIGQNEVLTIEDAIQQTNFQTQAILVAWRTCKPTQGYGIKISRATQTTNDGLTVYLELQDPVPGSALPAALAGFYEITRIPWPETNPEQPALEIIEYTNFLSPEVTLP